MFGGCGGKLPIRPQDDVDDELWDTEASDSAG
jgi:hypothetical protein